MKRKSPARWRRGIAAVGAGAALATGWALAVPVPDGECRLFEDFRGRIYVAVPGDAGGVFELDETQAKLKPVVPPPLNGAAVTFSGEIFTTCKGRIQRRVPMRGDAATDVTDKFGGSAAGDGEVVVTDDERVRIRGCPRFRETDGSYSDVPARGQAKGDVLPLARDIAGNDWTLDDAGTGAARRPLISPAQLRLPPTSGDIVLPTDANATWKAEAVNHGLTPGDWKFLAADDVGAVWVSSADSVWILHLRREPRGGTNAPPPNSWVQVRDARIAGSAITAVARRPLGGILVGYADGRVLQVSTADFADWQAAQKPPGKANVAVLRPEGGGPIRGLWVDRAGRLWVVAGGSLAPVGDPQWQGWRRRPPFPWGLMGAGACSYQDRLYVGGSLHGIYGLPPSSHTGALDVMVAGRDTPWAPAARLRLGRGFTGASEWRGRLWVMCGTSIEWHGCGPTDWVENFDPKMGDLDIGPRVYGWRAHAAAVVWQDRLYVMGVGMRVSEYGGFMESLGAGEKAWRKEEEPPVSFTRTTEGGIYDRIPVSACLLDNVFYVATSQHGLLAYFPSAQTWRVDLARAPEQPFHPHVVAVNDEVWLIANEAVHAYIPAKNEWRRVAALPTRREWGFAGRMGDELAIGGGYPCGAGGRQIFASPETFSLALPKERME